MSPDSNRDPRRGAGWARLRGLESAGGHASEWSKCLAGRSRYRDHVKLGGRLPMEVWADKQLTSERKMGRELGPWLRNKIGQEGKGNWRTLEQGSSSGNTGQRLTHVHPITRTGGQDGPRSFKDRKRTSFKKEKTSFLVFSKAPHNLNLY